MPTEVESDIAFTYDEDASFDKHDKRNTVWQGVDFVIDRGSGWIWLEVKNYRRLTRRQRSLSESQVGNLCEDLVGKFLGTTSFLAHTGDFECKPLVYAVLLEVPSARSDLLVATSDRINRQIRPKRPWKSPMDVIVVNLDQWNERFPEFIGRRM